MAFLAGGQYSTLYGENAAANTWSPILSSLPYSGTTRVTQIHGISPTNFWVMSTSYLSPGTTHVSHCNGSIITEEVQLASSNSLGLGLFMVSATDGWASVLDSGNGNVLIYRYQSGTWSLHTTFAGSTGLSYYTNKGRWITGNTSKVFFCFPSTSPTARLYYYDYGDGLFYGDSFSLTGTPLSIHHKSGTDRLWFLVQLNSTNSVLYKYTISTATNNTEAVLNNFNSHDVFEDTATNILITGYNSSSTIYGGEHYVYDGSSATLNYLSIPTDTSLKGTFRVWAFETGKLRMSAFKTINDYTMFGGADTQIWSKASGSWVLESPSSGGFFQAIWGMDGSIGGGCFN